LEDSQTEFFYLKRFIILLHLLNRDLTKNNNIIISEVKYTYVGFVYAYAYPLTGPLADCSLSKRLAKQSGGIFMQLNSVFFLRAKNGQK